MAACLSQLIPGSVLMPVPEEGRICGLICGCRSVGGGVAAAGVVFLL